MVNFLFGKNKGSDAKMPNDNSKFSHDIALMFIAHFCESKFQGIGCFYAFLYENR